MAYPKVKIFNSTNYIASGTVEYMSALCSNDHYNVTPNTQWKAKSRGVCLLTKITATLKTPNGDIVATPYESSGTSYSDFSIIAGTGNTFRVTRNVS
ncbi:MAG: hypothetical protein LKI53_09610 [Bacteroidales bacterium]|jgi:hypothetical protein|nr:hypothetical protein [Bacteroidales bacterium]